MHTHSSQPRCSGVAEREDESAAEKKRRRVPPPHRPPIPRMVVRSMFPARSAQWTAAAHLATLSSAGTPRDESAALEALTCGFVPAGWVVGRGGERGGGRKARGGGEARGGRGRRRACIHGVAMRSELLRKRTTPRLASTRPRTPGMMMRIAAPTTSGSWGAQRDGGGCSSVVAEQDGASVLGLSRQDSPHPQPPAFAASPRPLPGARDPSAAHQDRLREGRDHELRLDRRGGLGRAVAEDVLDRVRDGEDARDVREQHEGERDGDVAADGAREDDARGEGGGDAAHDGEAHGEGARELRGRKGQHGDGGERGEGEGRDDAVLWEIAGRAGGVRGR